MADIVTTAILAAILVVIALALLGIGYLLTGTNRLRKGGCGRLPDKEEDKGAKSCSNGPCSICRNDREGPPPHQDNDA